MSLWRVTPTLLDGRSPFLQGYRVDGKHCKVLIDTKKPGRNRPDVKGILDGIRQDKSIQPAVRVVCLSASSFIVPLAETAEQNRLFSFCFASSRALPNRAQQLLR